MKKIISTLVLVTILVMSLCSVGVSAAEANELYLYQEGGSVSTGWWFNPVSTDHYFEVSFTAEKSITGFKSFYYASVAAVEITHTLIDSNNQTVATAKTDCSGNADFEATFDKVAPAGTYTLRIACTKVPAEGGHFVLGSAPAASPAACTIGNVNAQTNDQTQAAPYIVILLTDEAGEQPPADNPNTSDVAVVFIAAVASLSLAGFVVCKKVKA